MTGSSDDAAQPPRRRRRASRRAAGPPVSVSTPAVAELPDDADLAEPADQVPGPHPADPTLGAQDTTMDIGAAVDARAADAIGAPAAAARAGPSSAVTAAVDDTGHAHGSPANTLVALIGLIRYAVAHGHSPAQVSPGQGPPSSAVGRDRSGDRSAAGGAAMGETPRRSGRPTREEASERSLRSLVTTRSTQVSPTAALRAREVGLPSVADLEAAEAELVIVRRHYVPPTTLAAGRRQDWPNRRGSGGQGGARPPAG